MKLSIIIPIYNAEAFLSECLDSVCTQTLSDGMEIICINDGSTDRSLEILNEYKKNDSRIIVIDQNNAGVSAARNKGIEIAKGEYITFVDADDSLQDLENCLQKVANKDLYFFDFVNENPVSGISNLQASSLSFSEESEDLLKAFLEFKKIRIRIGSFIIKTKILHDKHLIFNEYFKYGEDLLFIYQISMLVSSYEYIPNIILKANINDFSAINKKPSLRRFDVYFARLYFLEYCKQNSIFLSEQFISDFKKHTILESIVINFQLLARNLYYPIELKKFMKENNMFAYIHSLKDRDSEFYIPAIQISTSFYQTYFNVVFNELRYRLKSYIYQLLKA